MVLVGLAVLLVVFLKQPGKNKPPTKDKEPPVVAKAPTKKTLTTAIDDAWLKQVATMTAEQQVAAVAAKLKELNEGFDGKVTPTIQDGVVTELQFLTDNVTDISPIRALRGLNKLTCSGSSAGKGSLSDLTPLKGMKLTRLVCDGTNVSDLSPLKDMKLTALYCNRTQVEDLSPLKDMRLTILWFDGAPVSDLTPLKSLPLTSLLCAATKVTDLSP